mgnify:FL=1
MGKQTIVASIDDGIARVALDRPEQLNAINRLMISELNATLSSFAGDPSIKVVILSGHGRAFSAGGDVGEHHATFLLQHAERRASVAHALDGLGDVILSILRFPRPVIASVQGACLGAAVGLAAAADVVIAADDSRFQLAQGKLGLSIDGGTSYLLPRLIGLRAAQRMALTGEAIDAAVARQLGLVSTIVPEAKLAEKTDHVALEIARFPSAGLERSKALLLANLDRGPAAALAAETSAVVESFLDPAFEASVQAFLNSRKRT